MELKEFITSSPRGTAKRMASYLGVSPSYLSQIASNESLRTPQLCVKIEIFTEGKVPRQHSRSDWASIWPELVDAA